MACKQGIRKDMERSREFYQMLKEYDPVRELWVSLVRRSTDDPSLQGWSKPELTYFAVCLLDGEVHNGGFDQYFSNSSADYYLQAVEGLEELQAQRALELLREAASEVFGETVPPRTQSERWVLMRQSPQTSLYPDWETIMSRRLGELDHAFYEVSEELVNSLTHYAEIHGLIEPFKQDS